MNPDQLLAGALQDVADDYVPVGPDVRAITAGGRRRRRARNVRRGVVVAAVVAAVVAVPLLADPFGSRATGPVDNPTIERVTDLPVGDPPEIPYCPGDGTLRGAGDPVDVECDVMIHRGDSTLVLDRDGVSVLEDGRLTLLDSRAWSSWYPALSLDGRWAAWVTKTPDSPHKALLLGFDLRNGTSVEVPWIRAAGWVAGIDDLGRVYFEDYRTTDITVHDLSTGETTVVAGVPDHVSPRIKFVDADGFAIATNHEGIVAGVVTADGSFTQQRRVDRGWSTYSPDRAHVVHEPDFHLAVEPASSGGPVVPLQLPQRGAPVWFPVWESPDAVLVQFDPEGMGSLTASGGLDSPAERTWLLRCQVDDGSCEVALEPGWGDRMTGPVYR